MSHVTVDAAPWYHLFISPTLTDFDFVRTFPVVSASRHTRMSARRQASTTSLSKFARTNTPPITNRSSNFCNAFWGAGDGGVEVLFARMRGAARTMDELKCYLKERYLSFILGWSYPSSHMANPEQPSRKTMPSV